MRASRMMWAVAMLIMSLVARPAVSSAEIEWKRTAPLSGRILQSLAIDGTGSIYGATFDGGVSRSDDNGQTWTSLNSNPENLNIFDVLATRQGSVLCATFGGGILRSHDWELVGGRE